jgi:hypothetical protein
MNPSTLLLAVSVAMMSGCNSPSGGGVEGTVMGKQFVMVDAISSSVVAAPDPGIEIVMTSTANACADLANNVLHPNETSVAIFLTDNVNGESAVPTAPGTYPIVNGSAPMDPEPPKAATFYTNIVEATCGHDGHEALKTATADSGTVTLIAVSADQVSGTFDVMLNTGDHISGSFDPQTCGAFGQQPPSGSPICE